MAEKDLVLFDVEDGVGIITLNRPDKLNAINWNLAEVLANLLRDLRTRDEVRTIVLAGAGRGFCAGGDAEWLSGEGEQPMPGTSDPNRPIPRYQRKTPGGPFADVTRQIIGVEKPVIAAIHGPAVGAGLAYALACDRRFADTTTRMSAIFTRIGMSPDMGTTWLLPRIVGLSNALMMVETAKMFDAEEAKAIGLIDELVPEGQAFEAAKAYAKKLAQGPSVAIDMSRRFIYKGLQSSLEDMLDYEAVASTMTAATRDFREGVDAFMEKRKAVFEGH
jgi:2-(1,2-epoxy-1,2-dihydrophenyl)acetyl-CoA isomerase